MIVQYLETWPTQNERVSFTSSAIIVKTRTGRLQNLKHRRKSTSSFAACPSVGPVENLPEKSISIGESPDEAVKGDEDAMPRLREDRKVQILP